ncbi:MAG: YkgJ family cysteine cluster protein [Desulfobulbaceae bacterium]|nr:YkgJ family cysteine cluster protein [Desulfobulbaceae bacterium]HIJ91606.1 YkgJ family cysteine cluster protein [Deltaproteobacteria bacterium]
MSKSQQTPQSHSFDKSLFASDNNPSNILPAKLTADSTLKFRCHPGVSCFTNCCGNINIILTPYDILRIRRPLNLPADEFLLRFTTPVFLEKTDLPGVKIHLDENGRCPFVTEEGCTIYPYRPTTCRYYPVGMSYFHAAGNEGSAAEEFYFLVKEPYCKGHEEPKEQTIREWRVDQGIDESDEMNREWMEIVMRRKSFGLQATLSELAQKMFFMASTDLDKFRDFVFNSSFLETYDVDEETLTKIKTDDIALMKFSCKYLASSIFGTKDLTIKTEKVKARVEQLKNNQGEAEKQAMETYEELRRDHDLLKKKIKAQQTDPKS